ncbi:hypothetical protein FB561_2284 [Kribbella amoyensis]|uniref:Uncharacterized protein n=2 Tax=Kribbella amoyensis TaxID=996641 RepID=A0A561BQM5_9ACTN|nr:hypothetical protein FB561_2284 [Kribbella amoyensis]
MALSGCDAGREESAAHQTSARNTPAPLPAGSLCDRVRPTLAGDWKAEDQPPGPFPLSDVCQLTNFADPNNRYKISVTVLPVSAADAAEFRKVEERGLKDRFVVEPVDGAVGQDSWSVNPAASGPWLVFRTGGRLVRVRQNVSGEGQLEAVEAVAQTIDSLPGGIPAAQAIQRRPECDRGTAAAERLLEAKASARRDTLVNGFVTCRWGSQRRAASTEGGGPASEAWLGFTNLKDAGDDSRSWVRRVAVGKEGWQQDDGFLAYKITENAYVNAAGYPPLTTKSAKVLDLARAIAPAYRR